MPTNAHTHIIEKQLYNTMCLSSGTLIIDVCIRWNLFDICGFMHGTCWKFKSKNTVCHHVYCRDTMTNSHYVLSKTYTQTLKLVTSLIGAPDLIRKTEISLHIRHIGLYINFNTDV